MPVCKNDPNRKYIGNEPSPTGLGYCAHAEEVNAKMKGLDNKMWIVKEYKGVKKWVHYDERPHILIRKLFPTWYKLAQGGLLAICKNKTYHVFPVSKQCKIKDIWKNL